MDDKHLDRFAGARKHQNPDCLNDGDVLVISRRHACWYICALLILLFTVFAAGYFCGKRRALERFIDRVEQDSLADQVYYTMGALYETKDLTTAAENADDAEQQRTPAPATAEPETSVAIYTPAVEEAGLYDSLVHTSTVVDLLDDKPQRYVAQLMGCGSPKAAQDFVKLMEQHGITVKIAERQSRTKKGRLITWYQLVTESLPREVLDPLVVRIKRIGRIQNDVKIVEK